MARNYNQVSVASPVRLLRFTMDKLVSPLKQVTLNTTIIFECINREFERGRT